MPMAHVACTHAGRPQGDHAARSCVIAVHARARASARMQTGHDVSHTLLRMSCVRAADARDALDAFAPACGEAVA